MNMLRRQHESLFALSPKAQHYLVWTLVLAPLLLACWLWLENILTKEPAEWFNLGLDLRGGLSVTYQAQWASLPHDLQDSDHGEILNECRDIILNRLEGDGINGAQIRVVPAKSLLQVDVPNVRDPNAVFRLLGRPGKLEFRLVLRDSEISSQSIESQIPFTYRDGEPFMLPLGPAEFTGHQLDAGKIRLIPPDLSSLDEEARHYRISLGFRGRNQHKWEEFTVQHAGEKLAITLDKIVQITPTIKKSERRVGSGNWMLTGQYTQSEATEHYLLLKHGQLPVDLKQSEVRIVGASLGATLRQQGYRSLAWAAVALLGTLCVFYAYRPWLLISALLSLLVLVLTFTAVLSKLRISLTVVSLAGCILTVAMGIDATVIILESLRQSIKKLGNSPVDYITRERIVDSAFRKRFEFPVLLHACVTGLITASILFLALPLRAFASVLIIGIVLSVANIFLNRRILLDTRSLYHIVLTAFPKWEFKRFSFEKARPLCTLICALGAGTGVFFIVTSSAPWGRLRLGSDFKSGTQIVVRIPSGCDAAEILNEARKHMPGDWRTQVILGSGHAGETTDAVATYRLTTSLAGLTTIAGRGVSERLQELTETTEDPKRPGSAAEIADHMPTRDRTSETVLAEDTPLGGFFKDLNALATRAGGRAKVLSISAVGPAIAAERLRGSIAIVALSMFAVALYILVFINADKFSAIGTLVALVHDVLVVLAILAIVGIPVNYGVVAGLLAIIGYSVNDSIIFLVKTRQIRDDVSLKASSARQIITRAVNECFGRTLVTSLTTLLPILILVFAGGNALRGFAVTMSGGIVAGTLSSVFVVGNFALLRFASPKPASDVSHLSQEELNRRLSRGREE